MGRSATHEDDGRPHGRPRSGRLPGRGAVPQRLPTFFHTSMRCWLSVHEERMRTFA